MNDDIGRAIDIMIETAQWLEDTMPEGGVELFSMTGDYQMLVAELRRAAEALTSTDPAAPGIH